MEKSNGVQRWSLAGLTALVTGGTKGIGHAIVEELAGLGAAVHTCSRNEAELKKCLQKWADMNPVVTGSVCDVSSRAERERERERLIERVCSVFQGEAHYPRTGIRKPAQNFSAEEYSYLMASNLESSFHLSQMAHPLLKTSGRGSIVFISSIAGGGSYQKFIRLLSNQGALNQLTNNLACEWANDNIRTYYIAPGHIATRLIQKWVLDNEETKVKEASRVPLGRLGEPEAQRMWAPLTAFLCMPIASYINGQVICLDGDRAIYDS